LHKLPATDSLKLAEQGASRTSPQASSISYSTAHHSFFATAKMHVSNFVTLISLPLVLASHLRVSIPSSQQLQHPNTLPASTHATLTTLSNTYSAPLRSDNTFDFRNVTSGSYLFDVHCHTHAFAPLRVDVHEITPDGVGFDGQEVQVWGTFRGNEWSNKGEVVQAQNEDGIWSFDVRAQAGKDYFIERTGCESRTILFQREIRLLMLWNLVSPLSLLKNPMILIAGVSMLIVFGMPYIMDNSSSLFSYI
jgi:hypothetical protein